MILVEGRKHLFGVRWLISHSIAQLIVMDDSLLEFSIEHRVLEVIPDVSWAIYRKLVHIFPEILHNCSFFLVFDPLW